MKYSKVSEIFEVSYGTKLDMNKMKSSDSSDVAFVSRSSKNNGVVGYVDRIQEIEPLTKGVLTVTLGGTYVLSSFLQESPFYTAQNVAVLKAKQNLSKQEKLYYCLCITANRFRYSAFGREANRTLKDIIVPSVDSIPSWVYGIDFNQFDNAAQKKVNKKLPVPLIEKTATIEELFDIRNGVVLTGVKEFEERFDGSVMYIRPASTHLRTRRSFISSEQVDKSNIYPPGTLFVSTNGEGSHTYSYVSTEAFVPNSDVSVLIPKIEIPIEVKMYYAKCITSNRYLFSYGRKPKGNKLKKVSVPQVTESNMCDVVEFIHSLKYSSTAF